KFKRGSAALGQMRGFVRGFKPSEFVGTFKQGDRGVVLSPSTLGAFGVPQNLDKVAFLAGSTATVQSVEQIHLNDVLVRINIIVRGD
ncbi:hypothetical protein, partial [Devosia sp.]|uniref:hypothetical protein n=1 Tax=Devosia sp. TaxID=1871048 RepID=UPI001ACA13F1